MKTLLLDIETAPNLAYVWGIWEQNISTGQIVDSSYILCWAAKWLGEKEVMFDSIHQSTEKKMLKGIHKRRPSSFSGVSMRLSTSARRTSDTSPGT